MKLYELQDNLVAIDNILENNTNPETQEILESARADLLKEIDGKVENILAFMSDCKGRVEQLRAEEERIAKKRKSLENKVEYLKNMVYWFMKSNNQQKAEFGTWNCTVAKTAGKVVFDVAVDDFPLWLKQIEYSVNKTAVKERMVDGVLCVTNDEGDRIQLAHMEEGESLRIK